MAAGDLVVADYMAEIRTTAMGVGTNYDIADGSWASFRSQEIKTADLDLLGDGVSPGVDRLAAKTVALTIRINHATPATLESRLATLLTAWAPGATTTLHWQLGGTKRFLNGRARRLVVDENERPFGRITVICEFFASDPIVRT